MSKKNSKNLTLDEKLKDFSGNEEMVITRVIEKTPFIIVGALDEKRDGRNWFIALGQVKISPDLASEKEALDYIKDITWSKICDVVVAVLQGVEQQKVNLKKLSK